MTHQILVASVIVLLSTPAWGAGTFFCRNLDWANDLNTPGFDLFLVACPTPVQIRARVFSDGEEAGNSVTTICIASPIAAAIGTGDHEVTRPGVRIISERAETNNCTRAAVSVTCDGDPLCSEEQAYCLQLECANSPATPFVIEKINR